MRNVLSLAGLIFVFAAMTLAQSTQEASCPLIAIVGPAGIVAPNHLASFSVTVDTKGNEHSLKYKWSVSEGSITSGQGTPTIEVPVPQSWSVIATVEVEGLPPGCTNLKSWAHEVCLDPGPIKLDEFVGPLTKIPIEQINTITDAARSAPNAQLYILISGNSRNPSQSVRTKRAKLLKEFFSKLNDDRRVTVIETTKNDDHVQIFLVPAGVSPPSPD